jgi:hypothetical protein
MTELLEAPDIFGYTIFCDDIRYEADGKVTYVGTYNQTLIVKAKFPITLPKFGLGITFAQRAELFTMKLGLKVFLPGDVDEAASIETDLGANPLPVENPNNPYIFSSAHLLLTPLIINSPGDIKVRILREGFLHRLGTVSVSSALE